MPLCLVLGTLLADNAMSLRSSLVRSCTCPLDDALSFFCSNLNLCVSVRVSLNDTYLTQADPG